MYTILDQAILLLISYYKEFEVDNLQPFAKMMAFTTDSHQKGKPLE